MYFIIIDEFISDLDENKTKQLTYTNGPTYKPFVLIPGSTFQ